MKDFGSFELHLLDYLAFGTYFVVLCLIGYWFGRKKQQDSADYFLAGRTLPWYVVGSSFIASNISSEHFIGMIGAAFIYGIAPAMFEWANVATFTLLIWFFIPFLLAAKVFSTPEFLERRFNPAIRQFFACVTVISNVVAFLAAVLYGGGLALEKLFGWDLWLAITLLAVVSGGWAVYGGLRSVAWMDVFTVIIMIAGGLMVTILGLYMLSGESHSLVDGFRVMIERNRAEDGIWAEVVRQNAPHIVRSDHYDRLSVIQPVTHELTPWPGLIMMIFSVSIWYNVINQFMIQRVLGAKDMYHARMGIVLAGYMKIILPAIVVLPGLILFARYPEVMKLPWDEIRPEADKGYVSMLQSIVPIGLRGLFLAALFGAIQSTVSAVLNSTSTIITVDIYKRVVHKSASESRLVLVGRVSSVIVMVIAAIARGLHRPAGRQPVPLYPVAVRILCPAFRGGVSAGHPVPPHQRQRRYRGRGPWIRSRHPAQSLCAVSPVASAMAGAVPDAGGDQLGLLCDRLRGREPADAAARSEPGHRPVDDQLEKAEHPRTIGDAMVYERATLVGSVRGDHRRLDLCVLGSDVVDNGIEIPSVIGDEP